MKFAIERSEGCRGHLCPRLCNLNQKLIYLSGDDVDEFHKDLLSKGLKPSTKPQDQPWGNREFIIRDPDGYNLMIFKRN